MHVKYFIQADTALRVRSSQENLMSYLRQHPRLEIPLHVDYLLQGSDAQQQGTIRNLSAGGAAMDVEQDLAEGTYLSSVRFALPRAEDDRGPTIEAEAAVIATDTRTTSQGELQHVARIRFLRLGPDQFSIVQSFVFQNLTKPAAQPQPAIPASKRISLDQTVVMRFDRLGDFEKMASYDISETGMFVATEQLKSPGEVVEFEIRLGGDLALIMGRGEVVWCRRLTQGPEQPQGMGIRFLELDETSERIIRRLVEREGHTGPPAFNFSVSGLASAVGATTRYEAPTALPVAQAGPEPPTQIRSSPDDLLAELSRVDMKARSIRAEAHQVEEGLTRDLESAASTETALRNRIRELEEALGSQIEESGEDSAS